MKTIFCLVIAFCLITACHSGSGNTQDQEVNTQPMEVSPATPTSTPICYAGILNADSCYLKTVSLQHAVTGLLNYNYHTKEKQIGRFRGKMYGDTLIADYTYINGEKTSMRQVAFLLHDQVAEEGMGVLENQDGKLKFKDLKAIQFGKGIKMNRTECVHNE